MKKMTIRILIAVAVAGLVGVIGNLFLASRISDLTNQYNEMADIYLINEEYVSLLRGDIYYMQSLISNHVVTTQEEQYDIYEEEIARMDTRIRDELAEFAKRLDEPEDKELLHQVTNNYCSFYSQAEVAISLSRVGTKQSAEYYVCNAMADFVVLANDNLEKLNEKMQNEMLEARMQLEHSAVSLNVVKRFSIALVLIAAMAGAAVVAFNARGIVEQQLGTQKQHEKELLNIQTQVIVGMANLIESRDGETGQHVKRTSDYVEMVAHELKKDNIFPEIDDDFMENISKAAPLHDIGKIKVPDSILQKPGKLTPEEFEIIKQHAQEGGDIIYNILSDVEKKEYLDIAHDVATYHHEKWDGSGYPEHRKEDEIPLCARIMAIADVFDALISKRCYKEAFSIDQAYGIIKESSGTHFDPRIADEFIKMRPQIETYLQNEKA